MILFRVHDFFFFNFIVVVLPISLGVLNFYVIFFNVLYIANFFLRIYFFFYSSIFDCYLLELDVFAAICAIYVGCYKKPGTFSQRYFR